MAVKKESRYFYTPLLEGDTPRIQLSENESHHITNVLRYKEGDSLLIMNGRGLLCEAHIAVLHKKRTEVEVDQVLNEIDQSEKLTLAIAPTKSIDRFEWLLEKATEIGVKKIVPILVDNSERKVLKMNRVERVVVAAMKQCGRLWKPEVTPMTKIDHYLEEAPATKYIAHCAEGEKKSIKEINEVGEVTFFVGPEGGFSPREIGLAISKGCQPVSLGQYRLRSETAGIVLCQHFGLQ